MEVIDNLSKVFNFRNIYNLFILNHDMTKYDFADSDMNHPYLGSFENMVVWYNSTKTVCSFE